MREERKKSNSKTNKKELTSEEYIEPGEELPEPEEEPEEEEPDEEPEEEEPEPEPEPEEEEEEPEEEEPDEEEPEEEEPEEEEPEEEEPEEEEPDEPRPKSTGLGKKFLNYQNPPQKKERKEQKVREYPKFNIIKSKKEIRVIMNNFKTKVSRMIKNIFDKEDRGTLRKEDIKQIIEDHNTLRFNATEKINSIIDEIEDNNGNLTDRYLESINIFFENQVNRIDEII
jgi:hypothetical protein